MRDAAAGWRRSHTVALVVVAIAALLPRGTPSWVHLDAAANGLYLALAATGLWLAAGLGGMPSLGQGGFMAIGALVVSVLGARRGWPMLPAVAAGVAAATAAGYVVGIGVVRLRPVFVGVTTWILAWTVGLALVAFPSLLGGGHGVVVPSALSVGQHYELALALLVAAILLAASFGRGPGGIELRAARRRPAAAAALGVPTARRRLVAFVTAAAVGGLAGGLAVQLAGVADAADYGPALSFHLFVAVVLGGAASALGPAAGIAGVAFVTWAGGSLDAAAGVATERFDPMIAGALLLVVIATGSDGIVPELRRLLARRSERAAPGPQPEPPPTTARRRAAPAPLLVAEGLTKRYGALAAADDVALEVGSGEICALVGPNGSGKTTVLRLLGGTLAPDCGRVLLAGDDLAGLPPRERALRGVVRTLQSTAAFADLTGSRTCSSARAYAAPTAARSAPPPRRRSRGRRTRRRGRLRAPRSRRSASLGRRTSRPRRSQRRSSGCSASRPRSPRSHGCCCWTSRPPARRRPTSSGSRRCSPTARPRASQCSSSSTISGSCARSPTGSW